MLFAFFDAAFRHCYAVIIAAFFEILPPSPRGAMFFAVIFAARCLMFRPWLPRHCHFATVFAPLPCQRCCAITPLIAFRHAHTISRRRLHAMPSPLAACSIRAAVARTRVMLPLLLIDEWCLILFWRCYAMMFYYTRFFSFFTLQVTFFRCCFIFEARDATPLRDACHAAMRYAPDAPLLLRATLFFAALTHVDALLIYFEAFAAYFGASTSFRYAVRFFAVAIFHAYGYA